MSSSEFIPDSIKDDIAKITDWTPLLSGGTNTSDYIFNPVSSRRVEFKAGTKMYIISSIFVLIGIGAVIKFSFEPSGSIMYYGGIGLGIMFILTGSSKMLGYRKSRVFDLENGYFWREQKSPNTNEGTTSNQCRIKDIHAIQLIQEEIQKSAGSNGNSSYYSFEMNLVLENAERVNVVDHGSLSRIRKDTDKLSEFLHVPVWDAINSEY